MKKNTREFIVETTLKIISSESMQNVTVRRIADEAGVNIAAINYHFGSKAALIQEALQLFRLKTRDVFSVLEKEDLDTRERIRILAHRFADHLVKYPGFLNTFVASIIQKQPPLEAAVLGLKQHSQMMFALLKEHLGQSDEIVNNTMVQFVSALIYPVIIGEKADELYHIPFSDAEYRRRYIDQLLDIFNV